MRKSHWIMKPRGSGYIKNLWNHHFTIPWILNPPGVLGTPAALLPWRKTSRPPPAKNAVIEGKFHRSSVVILFQGVKRMMMTWWDFHKYSSCKIKLRFHLYAIQNVMMMWTLFAMMFAEFLLKAAGHGQQLVTGFVRLEVTLCSWQTTAKHSGNVPQPFWVPYRDPKKLWSKRVMDFFVMQKTLVKWMIGGLPYFWKHRYIWRIGIGPFWGTSSFF